MKLALRNKLAIKWGFYASAAAFLLSAACFAASYSGGPASWRSHTWASHWSTWAWIVRLDQGRLLVLAFDREDPVHPYHVSSVHLTSARQFGIVWGTPPGEIYYYTQDFDYPRSGYPIPGLIFSPVLSVGKPFSCWTFQMPLWIPAVCSIAFIAIPVCRRLLKTRRDPLACPTCSYDLRSHAPGNKCPECGTPVMGNTTFRPRGRLENETPNHTH